MCNASRARGDAHESFAANRGSRSGAGGGRRRGWFKSGNCGRLFRCWHSSSRLRRKQCQRRPNNSAGVADRLAGGCFQNWLARKSCRLDSDISRQDDDIGVGNILLCENPFLARRALGLNLDLMTQRSSDLLERFRRHYGVRNASRTGGDSNDFFHTERFRNCGFLRLDL